MQLQIPTQKVAATTVSKMLTAKPRGLSLLSHLVAYALLISAPVLLFSIWMVNHYSKAEREATEQQARWYARDLSKSIEHELRRVADQLNTLSHSRSLLGGDLENLYRRASHAAQIFRGSMVVRDASGQQLLNTRVAWGTPLPVSALPQDARDDLAAGRPHISDLYIGAVKRQPVVTVTIPILEDKRLTHSISLSLDPATLLTGLGIPLPPPGWIARIADRQGIIIASTQNQVASVGQPAIPIPRETLTQDGNTDEWGDDVVTTLEGVHALRAYHRSPLSGWTTTVMMPFAQLEKPFEQRWQALAWLGKTSLGMSVLLAFVLAHQLVQQFNLIAQRASSLMTGNPVIGKRSSVREVNGVIHSLTTAETALTSRDNALRESEAQLRAVFGGSPIGMFRADLDKNFTYANPRLCEFANASLERMLGRTWMATLERTAREQICKVWDSAMVEGKSFETEFQSTSVKRGLGLVHGHIYAVPEYNADGRLIGYIGTVSDITQRKQAEAARDAQRDRFEQMLLATPDMVYLHEVGNAEIGFLNRDLGEVLGFPERGGKDLTYADLDAMVAPEDLAKCHRHREVMRHARDGEVHQVEVRLRIPNSANPHVYLLVRSVVFARGGGGAVHQVLGVVTDITARKAAEARVAEEVERFKRMTHASPDLIYLYDRQAHMVTDLSRSLREVLGHPSNGSAARGADDMYEFIFPEDLDAAHDHIRSLRAARDGVVYSHESRFKGADGGTRWLHNRSVVFSRHDDGRVHKLVCFTTDITDRKLVNEALARSNAELEAQVGVEVKRREQAQRELARAQNLEAIGRLTGGVAHDFNNVLTVVMGSLQLFKKRHKEAVPLSLINDALDGAETGRRLTQQLLSFARRQRLDPITINLGDHLGGVVRWIETTLHESIEVRTNFDPDIGTIKVDETGLDSAVINLIMNAQDAMGDSGVLFVEAGNIYLAEADGEDSGPGDYVYLSISDTGSGIAPEIAQRIFEPFFTTKHGDQSGSNDRNATAGDPDSVRQQHHGSGLGLSSVYGFVRQSKGRIELRSVPGQGSCFTLYFPRVADTVQPLAGLPDETEDVVHGGGAMVLVVEDMPGVRKLMIEMLESLRYRTLEAETGVAARNMIQAARATGSPKIDAVLSDVVMPGGVSGPDLAHWIEDYTPEIAVVLMTGYDDGLQASECPNPPGGLARRAITRIAKPSTPRQISIALHEARVACAASPRDRRQDAHQETLVAAK
jgi:PAS domain S-box-containing protein